jgi:hypothetical protein
LPDGQNKTRLQASFVVCRQHYSNCAIWFYYFSKRLDAAVEPPELPAPKLSYSQWRHDAKNVKIAR